MFRIDKSEMREHMHAIKKEIEQARVESQTAKTEKDRTPPYWILLLAMLQIQK